MLRDAAKDAVKAALSIQKEAHDEAMQKLVDEQKKIHSPLSRTNLTRTSGITYNSIGGIVGSLLHLWGPLLDHLLLVDLLLSLPVVVLPLRVPRITSRPCHSVKPRSKKTYYKEKMIQSQNRAYV
jgi:hypothetical protein